MAKFTIIQDHVETFGTMSVTDSVSQTFTLARTNQAKFWLYGNGTAPYLVSRATLTQGALSIPVTVNSMESFYVPAEGRWSDFVSVANFALPGSVTFNAYVTTSQTVPTYPASPTAPAVVKAVDVPSESSSVVGEVLFDVEFEGTLTDSINGLVPDIQQYLSIETGTRMFGNGCLKLGPDGLGNFTSSPYGDNAALVYTPREETVAQMLASGWTLNHFYYVDGVITHVAACYAKVSGGFNLYGFMNGGLIAGPSWPVFIADGSVSLSNYIANTFGGSFPGQSGNYIDGWQVVAGALWTANFTPLTLPITPNENELIELSRIVPLTVTTNPHPGDTLAINGGTAGNVTFTFVDHYPNNSLEIEIGATVNETAVNIAKAVNGIFGAEFVATVDGNVVTVTAYSPTSTITGTGGRITFGTQLSTYQGTDIEELSISDSFTATEGGKAVQEVMSISDSMDGLIDDISEEMSASTVFDVPMDTIGEELSISTNFDGLIDSMGESND